MNIKIRQERVEDYKEVYSVIEKAFKGAEHTDGNEQNLVESLSKSNSFISELSLVLEVDEKLIGHILFTEVKIANNIVLGLAPISVLPKYQNKGIGGKLIKEGHRIAKKLGYKGVVLLGYPDYYTKFGYVPAVNYGIENTFEVPEEFFMAVELKDGSLDKIEGVVEFPKEFKI